MTGAVQQLATNNCVIEEINESSLVEDSYLQLEEPQRLFHIQNLALQLDNGRLWQPLEVLMTKKNLIERISGLEEFRLHTGNINAYVELKIRKFKDSAEELRACLEIQLQSTSEDIVLRDNGTVLLCDNAHISDYSRGDLKITLKVFLSAWNPKEIEDAVSHLMTELNTDNIELLIVSIPELDIIDGETEAEEMARWKVKIIPIWNCVQALVRGGNVCSLGLSEATVSQLQFLIDEYDCDVRPTVNHLRHDGCCAVPQELKDYANEHDISLLTHNDPYPFPVKDVFGCVCAADTERINCCPAFETTWAARYTVWVRCRSVMASKGYMVQFKNKTSPTNGNAKE